MSRNSEKAQSMLFRFREQQAADLGIIDIGRSRRPKWTGEVESRPMAEKWRAQVIREISQKITKIQDPALSEFQLRDVNDQINKLMREKRAWEYRVKELGGPNYLLTGASNQFDIHGKELPNSRGYKYFGRARELAEVKEMLEAQAKKQARAKETTSKASATEKIASSLSATYYGLGEETQELLSEEREFSRQIPRPIETTQKYVPVDIDIPTQKDVEQYLISRRKQQLESRYGIDP